MSDKSPQVSSFMKLRMLRNRMAIHNPESEDVVTMDWAIHVLEKFEQATGRLEYLIGCLK